MGHVKIRHKLFAVDIEIHSFGGKLKSGPFNNVQQMHPEKQYFQSTEGVDEVAKSRFGKQHSFDFTFELIKHKKQIQDFTNAPHHIRSGT